MKKKASIPFHLQWTLSHAYLWLSKNPHPPNSTLHIVALEFTNYKELYSLKDKTWSQAELHTPKW